MNASVPVVLAAELAVRVRTPDLRPRHACMRQQREGAELLRYPLLEEPIISDRNQKRTSTTGPPPACARLPRAPYFARIKNPSTAGPPPARTRALNSRIPPTSRLHPHNRAAACQREHTQTAGILEIKHPQTTGPPPACVSMLTPWFRYFGIVHPRVCATQGMLLLVPP
jgi:hypothetical protein